MRPLNFHGLLHLHVLEVHLVGALLNIKENLLKLNYFPDLLGLEPIYFVVLLLGRGVDLGVDVVHRLL